MPENAGVSDQTTTPSLALWRSNSSANGAWMAKPTTWTTPGMTITWYSTGTNDWLIPNTTFIGDLSFPLLNWREADLPVTQTGQTGPPPPPPPRPQPLKPGTAGAAIIDRMNRHESPVEVDVLPRDDEVVTWYVIRRALAEEIKNRANHPSPETKATGPKGWSLEDLDISLAGFNTDGSIRFVVTLRYRDGDYW
jgi:hypothetical protein